MIENLNTSFWCSMERATPKTIKAFRAWIDEYKQDCNWNNLFMQGRKFHDLPYEMQMGIMNRFFIEMFAGKKEYIEQKPQLYHLEMREALQHLEKRLQANHAANS